MPITEKQIQFNAQKEASRKVLQKMKEAPLFVDTVFDKCDATHRQGEPPYLKHLPHPPH